MSLMSSFTIDNSQADKVTISELALVYHNVHHMLSYNSLDCGVKVTNQIYHDSPLANLITLGRTKSSALAEFVLGPRALELPLLELAMPGGSCRPFSVSSDASNKGIFKKKNH